MERTNEVRLRFPPAASFLDYRQETDPRNRWEDRFTSQTGDWSGNLYDFYQRAYNKLKQALKVPFKTEGIYRIDDTPAHLALREALANCLTNANYYERRGVVCLWGADALSLGKTRTNKILKSMIEDGTIRAEGTTHDRTYLANGTRASED